MTSVPGTITEGDLGNRAVWSRKESASMISSGGAEYEDDDEEVDADYASGLMTTSPPSIFLNHIDQILSARSKGLLYLAAFAVWLFLSLLLLELWYGGFDENFAPIVAGETIFDMGLKCFLLIYSMCYFGICIQQLIQKIQSPRRRTHHPPLRVCGLPRNALVCFFILPIVLAHTDWLSIFLIRRSGAATAIGIPSSTRTYEIEYPEAVQRFQEFLAGCIYGMAAFHFYDFFFTCKNKTLQIEEQRLRQRWILPFLFTLWPFGLIACTKLARPLATFLWEISLRKGFSDWPFDQDDRKYSSEVVSMKLRAYWGGYGSLFILLHVMLLILLRKVAVVRR